jgi:hypothetical protein
MPINTEPPKICPKCGSKVKEFKGISKKTGKPYHFWKCINVDCDYIWRKPSKADLRHEELKEILRTLYKEIKITQKMLREKLPEEKIIEEGEIPTWKKTATATFKASKEK